MLPRLFDGGRYLSLIRDVQGDSQAPFGKANNIGIRRLDLNTLPPRGHNVGPGMESLQRDLVAKAAAGSGDEPR